MSGAILNRQIVEVYMDYRKKFKQKIAATKAGISVRSAQSIDAQEHNYFKEPKTRKKTRQDPFEGVWKQDLVPLLRASPYLMAITLLEDLQYKHLGEYPDKLLRTLERRVRKWKAVEGPEKEVIFRQNIPPGWQSISDFTVANSLGVTINGQSFPHRLYHFRLSFSGQQYVKVIIGGESYTALAEGMQEALHSVKGSTKTHRTDSLSAAYKNLSDKDKEDFTRAYKEFCEHYGMEPTRNNKGVSHENGSIESPHRHLKRRIDQALMLRGSRDFSSIDEYRKFVDEVVARSNARNRQVYQEEVNFLIPLPEHKAVDFTELTVPISSSSTINVRQVTYSVPSRLISMNLKVHLYDDRLECFVGSSHVITLSRRHWKGGTKRVRVINYRHVIHSLVRKPGAFRNYIFKDEMFPTFAFRVAWEKLDAQLDERTACKDYVGILKIASEKDSELLVSKYLEEKLENNEIPRLVDLQAHFDTSKRSIPSVEVLPANPSSYDQLLQNN